MALGWSRVVPAEEVTVTVGAEGGADVGVPAGVAVAAGAETVGAGGAAGIGGGGGAVLVTTGAAASAWARALTVLDAGVLVEAFGGADGISE